MQVTDDTHVTVRDAPGRGSRPPSRSSECGLAEPDASAASEEDGFERFSVVPHVDSASLYEAVFERLSASEVSITILPLLPLLPLVPQLPLPP